MNGVVLLFVVNEKLVIDDPSTFPGKFRVSFIVFKRTPNHQLETAVLIRAKRGKRSEANIGYAGGDRTDKEYIYLL